MGAEPGRDTESVEDEEGHEREPEEHVEHDRRADALGAEGEPGVGTGHPGLGEQPVAERCARGGPPGRHVAEGERGQVDPEEAEALRSTVRQHRVRELGVGGQSGDLEEHAECEVGDVDVGEGVDLAAVAGEER